MSGKKSKLGDKADRHTVEAIIKTLQDYWSGQGCAILQPLDMPVGAGTFHPATFMRAIGPKPWKAAYVQPSRRPTDGRYGLHPNRLQKYYQFQVVLKPSPDDFQDIYLGSLKELGIDFREHDLRFVEDDWKSPTLGAWGLGWEVWCDGMEISQFTYFQEVGGIACKPVMGEITYGIERLAMYLQDCDDVYELDWNPSLKYGELHKLDEFFQSYYNYEGEGTTDFLQKRLHSSFDLCRQLLEETPVRADSELLRHLALNKGGVCQYVAAYEALLDCSHAFNLLDARGFYIPEKRARNMATINGLACEIARQHSENLDLEETKPAKWDNDAK